MVWATFTDGVHHRAEVQQITIYQLYSFKNTLQTP